MCAMEKIISCQLSFTPIQSQDHIKDVKKVLEVIAHSGLEHQVGALSTFIRGEEKRLFDLIKEVYQTMEPLCGFSMDVKISNLCGCK